MSAIAPTRQVDETVQLALMGNRRDLFGRVFQAGLLLSLLLSLAILVALLATALVDAWPVLSTRLGPAGPRVISRSPPAGATWI